MFGEGKEMKKCYWGKENK